MIAGLTGGIATGKSTVAGQLRELGAVVIDADQVARDIVQPGKPALQEIESTFGMDVLHSDGTLNRDALGAHVRNNPKARKQLEAITHPRIRLEIVQRTQEALSQGAPSVFVEAALLVETGSAALYPSLWVVHCSHETQVGRLMDRKGCDRQTAEEWIATQIPVEEKVRVATVAIDNDGDIEALHQQVREAYRGFMAQQPGQD